MEKKALGKGLEALLPGQGPVVTTVPREAAREVPLDQVMPNPFQPRRDFDEPELLQLAESIKQNGIIQPIIVRRKGDGLLELIAGERRLRAARLAGLSQVPIIIRTSTDEQSMALALVENLQRQDLNPMEVARAYHRLLNEFGFTQEELAQRLGKDRSSLANSLRLLNLPQEVQNLVESQKISTGHAKVILGLSRPQAQVKLAHRILQEQLSVRQCENLLAAEERRTKRPQRIQRQRLFPDLEQRLQKYLGTKVRIENNRRGGKIVIHYYAATDLDRVLELILG